MNYREKTAPALSWRRCHSVSLDNPLGGQRLVRFFEQDVAEVDGRALTTPAGYIEKLFDPAGSFALLDPETGAPTGEWMTHAQLYAALASLYLQTAAERDAQSQPPE